MGKFDGILLCSDFDLTMGVGGVVTSGNCEAIRYFQENGGLFTIISGRHPDFLKSHQNGFCVNAPLAGYNGALIKHHQTGEVLYSGGRNDHRAFALYSRYWNEEKWGMRYIAAHDATTNSFKCHRDPAKADFPTFEALEKATGVPLYNLMGTTKTPEEAIALRQSLERDAGPDFEVARSWSVGIEIICKEDGKGAAARRMKDMLGAKLLVAVGDFENDLSMIRDADIGYAVENAVPEVKAVADRHTVHYEQHAIAAIVAELERELA
ncbi:MAG: HAD-IIB family hydrolase [Clostridia bacterium]|nr:HAD-IIB family hydrolase [Clostridia bacterium]